MSFFLNEMINFENGKIIFFKAVDVIKIDTGCLNSLNFILSYACGFSCIFEK